MDCILLSDIYSMEQLMIIIMKLVLENNSVLYIIWYVRHFAQYLFCWQTISSSLWEYFKLIPGTDKFPSIVWCFAWCWRNYKQIVDLQVHLCVNLLGLVLALKRAGWVSTSFCCVRFGASDLKGQAMRSADIARIITIWQISAFVFRDYF